MITKSPKLKHATTIDQQTGDTVTIQGGLRVTCEPTVAWDLDKKVEIQVPAGTGVVLNASGWIDPIGRCMHGKFMDNSANIAYRF